MNMIREIIRQKSGRRLFWHMLIILFVISMEVTVVKLMGVPIAIGYFLPYYIPSILLFYVNAYIVMRLWEEKGKWITLFFILVELVFHYGIYFWIDKEVNKSLLIEPSRKDYIKAGYRTIYVFGISIAYWVVMRNKKQAQEIYELKLQALEHQNQQMALENRYLRAKADPHMAFNVLNVLYGKLENKMPSEAYAVKLLTDTMDFAIGNTGEDGKITIKEELVHVDSIIALHQFLNQNRYQIKYAKDIEAGNESLRIPPKVLSMLVDNIFMHGQLLDEVNPAMILLSVKGNKLVFDQSNLIALGYRKSHGLGMEFVRNCLAFYYHDQYTLTVGIDNNRYTTKLSIEL